jgi:hypothetical protein
MKVLYTNCQSIANPTKIQELNLLLSETNPEILLLTETWLSERIRFKIWEKYAVFRKDRENRLGGGVLIAVLKSLCPVQEDIPQPPRCEAVAISCTTTDHTLATFVSVYCPPDVDFDWNYLATLEQSYPKILIAGDFNAKNPIWGFSERPNPRGIGLADYIENSNLVILNTLVPKEPTFFPSQQNCHYEVLDLFLASPSLARKMTSLDFLSSLGNSDHICMLASFNETIQMEDAVYNRTFNFAKANWAQFAHNLEIFLSHENLDKTDVFRGADSSKWAAHIDDYAATLTKCILDAALIAVPTKNSNTSNSNRMKPSPTVMGLIKERRRLERQCKAMKKVNLDITVLRNQINFLQRQIRRQTTEDKRERWKAFTSSLNHRDLSGFWNSFRRIERGFNGGKSDVPALVKSQNNPKDRARTSQEKADVFATFLGSVFKDQNSPTFNTPFKEHVERVVRDHPELFQKVSNISSDNGPLMAPELQKFHDDCHVLSQEFSQPDLLLALKKTKNRSPGPDNIYNIFLKKGPPALFDSILKLFNSCFLIGYHPVAWKIGHVSMIPKPGKNPIEPSSYRPITLLSTLGKLLERLINHRILSYLEQEGKFNPTQSGFRPGRSTSDHLLRLSESVQRAFNRQTHVVAVFLDVQCAFDAVWHNGLLYKLYMNTEIPSRIIRWISSYLTNRQVQVRVKGFLSSPFVPQAGVPQGSVIAPLLFNIFVNDEPTVDRLTPQSPLLHSQFADDYAVWAASANPHLAAANVQAQLGNHERFCNNWRIKLNIGKTQVILFTRSGRATKKWRQAHSNDWDKVSVTLGGQQTFATRTAKFLGVTFDSSMSFKDHFTEIINRTHSRLNILKCLRGTDWGTRSETLLHLHKQVIRPVLEYGSISFLSASSSQKLRLQRIQNQALRIALRLPRYTPVTWLHEISGFETLDARWKSLALKYLSKNRDSTKNPFMSKFIELYISLCSDYDRRKTPIGLLLDLL